MFEADELKSDDIKPTPGTDELISKNDKLSGMGDDSIQKNLLEYKSKKTALETVFSTMEKEEGDYVNSGGVTGRIWDDKYLDDQLTSKVYSNKRETSTYMRNPYLKSYESVYKLKRIYDKIELALLKDKNSMNKLKDQNNSHRDIISNSNASTQKTINTQIEENNLKITELNKKIISNSKQAKLAKDSFDEKLSNFKNLMIEEEKKLKK